MKKPNLKIDINMINIKNIKNFLLNNMHKIITWFLSLVLLIIVLYAAVLWINIKTNYDKIQINLQEIKKIQDSKIISTIKKWNYRSADSVWKTAAVIYKNADAQEYIDAAKTLFLYTMYNDKSWNYKIKINEQLFAWMSDIDITQKEKFILNANNKWFLNEQWASLSNIFLKNYNDFIESNYFKSYINSTNWSKLDLALNKLSDPIYQDIKKTIENIYVVELLFIQEEMESEFNLYNTKYNQYMAPYNHFLSHIFLPSLDIWKDKFSQKINVDIFWWEYLDKAAYIDLNLVRYWSEYFEKSYKWKFYQWERNRVDNILVDDMQSDKEDKSLTNLWMEIKFGLNSDKSFYWLISKLTSTSNKKNVMIISEFTHYLWENIKSNMTNNEYYSKESNSSVPQNYMKDLVNKCLIQSNSYEKNSCWDLFWCKSSECKYSDFAWENFSSFKDSIDFSWSLDDSESLYNKVKQILTNSSNINKYNFKNSSFNRYFENNYYNIDDLDSFIWYRLTDCLLHDGYCKDLFNNKNDDFYVIKKTISDFANCDNPNLHIQDDMSCKMNFISKFDTNYFFAYTMTDKLNDANYSYLDRLKDVYKNLSWLLKIWEFTFKNQNSSLNDLDSVKYVSNTALSVYYRSLSDDDLNSMLSYIGEQQCSRVSNWKPWSITIWYNYIKDIINTLYKSDMSASWVYQLNDTLSILEDLKEKSEKADNLEKLLLNIQTYRILKEKGYCSK